MITKKLEHLIDFLERGTSLPSIVIMDMLLVFSCMYDIHALLLYFERAQENHVNEEELLETIVDDLNGITQNPETFRPRSADTPE